MELLKTSRKAKRGASKSAMLKNKKGETLGAYYFRKKKAKEKRDKIEEVAGAIFGALAFWALVWLWCAFCYCY